MAQGSISRRRFALSLLGLRSDAGWFSRAGFGLFLHWGPSSVGEVETGWGMFRDVAPHDPHWSVEKYNALAARFDPSNYQPDRWMEAAARAGFRYAVFTSRHADGYAMWPSDYGSLGTKQYLQGRDLVRPYIEACRRHGLKVGLYYSPTDWNFRPKGWPWHGFPYRDNTFAFRRPERTFGMPRFVDWPLPRLQAYFEEQHAYVKGQVGELLTRYGKIDLLWWDGYDWPVGIDHHPAETERWVRGLQPGIVINDRNMIWNQGRWGGDFNTAYENRDPEQRPSTAWEQCEAICGCWAWCGEGQACKSAAYLIERLARNRAWGGNYLAGFGPRADGTMAPSYYAICGELEGWMRHSGESVSDVEAGAWPERSDVPVTVRGSTWYLHFLSPQQRSATLRGVPGPRSATLLRIGARARWRRAGDGVVVELPEGPHPGSDEVVAVVQGA